LAKTAKSESAKAGSCASERGGLGSPLLLYLAAAGVGRLGIVDFDAVDLSNLQRQILHGTPQVGQPKTRSAKEAILRLNPEVDVVLHEERFTRQNAERIVAGYDLVVDGTDNFPTRYLTNDVCVRLGKPNIYGSVFRFEGQASVFAPHLGGPCYRCLYPEPPPLGTVPSCAEAGVLGVLPGLIGTIQATETLKLCLGQGDSLMGRLLLVDALAMRFREVKVRRDPECSLCGERATIKELVDYEAFCGVAADSKRLVDDREEVTVQDLQGLLQAPESGVEVIDVREVNEHAVARIEGVPLMPMSSFARDFVKLEPTKTYYFFCHHGVRSLQVVRFLKQEGFSSVKSVSGGIESWSREIDPGVPRY